ncbi:MAG: F0F1 ATP synthase subunit epsilon [SAR324 cluster bacterium]|nr:F0F1 ATP synthase subunit epsilon [SAR324 cluster bacterium]
MANQLQLEIVTPQKRILQTTTTSVTLPGSIGELGILPEHIPLLTTLNSGVLTYQDNGKTQAIAIHWGYAQVEGNRVTVLAQLAEPASEIDTTRAQTAEKKAVQVLTELIHSHSAGDDELKRMDKFEAKLKRALVRQQAARYQ